MPDPDLDRFEQLYRLADKLLAQADREALAETARILAMNLDQHRAKYGELPADEYPSLSARDNVTPELGRTLADGMENLVGGLAQVAGYPDPDAETY